MSRYVHISQETCRLIKKWEGFKPEVYQDVVGIDTIGYGFTAPALKRIGEPFPEVVTKRKADRLLSRLLVGHYGPEIVRAVPGVAGHKLGALCSFCYNVGLEAFRQSTLCAKLQAGKEEEAEEEFGRWVYAGGRILPGLVQRRKDERHYFEKDEHLYDELDVQVQPLPVRKVEGHEDVPLNELLPDTIDPYFDTPT